MSWHPFVIGLVFWFSFIYLFSFIKTVEQLAPRSEDGSQPVVTVGKVVGVLGMLSFLVWSVVCLIRGDWLIGLVTFPVTFLGAALLSRVIGGTGTPIAPVLSRLAWIAAPASTVALWFAFPG